MDCFFKGYLHKNIFQVNLDMTDSSPSIVWVTEEIVLLEGMPRTWGQSEDEGGQGSEGESQREGRREEEREKDKENCDRKGNKNSRQALYSYYTKYFHTYAITVS